jgi:xeroderma pigmentosum group C-complementing protein
MYTFPTEKAPPLEGWPPTIWTEVFSRPDSRWLPVDPIRYIVNKRKLMEPPSHDKENKMTYVLAYEEDGYVKDVTARYAKNYWSKTLKKRAGVKSGRQEWWSSVLSPLARPYRLVKNYLTIPERNV